MRKYLSLVKFSHTIFALPFALIGFFIALEVFQDSFSWEVFALVLLCMVFARNAAMAFNRYADRDIDCLNPRTAKREIPSGIITPSNALFFVLVNCVAFVCTTWFINKLCFYLSPVALLVILGYSYTKRFTYLCHFILGVGLSLAPIGAYLAVGGKFGLIPILYSLAVLTWVSGFDIIYALQDREFDSTNKLRSIPVKLGNRNALLLSSILHVCCGILILCAAYVLTTNLPTFNTLTWIGTLAFIFLLIYQHTIVKHDDLTRVNLAFFTTNGVASLILGLFVIIDFWG